MKNVYYVYMWYYKNELVYVGKGKGARWQHGNSGKSSCYELNKIHFLEGNENLRVEFEKKNLSNKEALDLEDLLIKTKLPKFNSSVKVDPHSSTKINKLHREFNSKIEGFRVSGVASNKECDRCLEINKQLFEVYTYGELSLGSFSFKGYCKLKKTKYKWLHRIIMNRTKVSGDGIHHIILFSLWKSIYGLDLRDVDAK